MRKRKLLLTGCMIACVLTTQVSTHVSATEKTTDSSQETSTDSSSTSESDTSDSTSENLTEGNWVYSISSSSQGGPGGDGGDMGTPPDGTGGGSDAGTAPDGTGDGSDAGTAPDGTGDGSDAGTASDGAGDGSDAGTAPEGTGDGSSEDGTSTTESTATILWGTGEEKNGNVVMIPAVIGGCQVTVLGNGAQNITSNNKISDNYVLIPEGVTTFSNRMIYDYNSTSGFSIPSTVTDINDGAFLSCPGTFYGESGSSAETYAESDSTRSFISYDEDGSTEFTATQETKGICSQMVPIICQVVCWMENIQLPLQL